MEDTPLMRSLAARRAAIDAQRAALTPQIDAAYADIDPTAYAAAAERLGRGRGDSLMLALAANEVSGMRPIAQHMLQQAGQYGSQKMTGGVLTPQGFIADPEHARTTARERLTRQEQLLDRRATGVDTDETRAARDAEARQGREDMVRLAASLRPAPVDNALVAVVGPDGNPTLVSRSQAAGMRPYVKPAGGTGANTQAQAAQAAQQIPGMIKSAEDYLKKATGGAVGNMVDSAFRAVNMNTEGSKANQALKSLSADMVGMLPRFAGAVSDADLAFMKQRIGDIGNETLSTGERLEALQSFRTHFERSTNTGGATGTRGGQSGEPSIDDLVNKYTKPKGR